MGPDVRGDRRLPWLLLLVGMPAGGLGQMTGPDSYPAEALRKREQGHVTLALKVGDNGRPISCAVTESSGSASLDRASCDKVMGRARFNPRPDGAGAEPRPFILPVHWVLPGITAPVERLVLLVAALPTGYTRPVDVTLGFDGTGTVVDCEVRTGSGSSAADRAACLQARHEVRIVPPRSLSALPAYARRNMTVMFEHR